MSKVQEITPDTKQRLNPALRKGTWDRVELFAIKNNIDSATHAVALEKIIHDHCDSLNIADPFVTTHEN